MREMFAGIGLDIRNDMDRSNREKVTIRGMRLSDDPFVTPWDLPAKKPRKRSKKIAKKS